MGRLRHSGKRCGEFAGSDATAVAATLDRPVHATLEPLETRRIVQESAVDDRAEVPLRSRLVALSGRLRHLLHRHRLVALQRMRQHLNEGLGVPETTTILQTAAFRHDQILQRAT
ncbi:MAG: hypothetical protein J0M12_01380 [Deltaproteobacteria bacterium]|nr:hypothetical protein [Deltaproteobacteria bacterium]